jgi:hypothetical protein
MALIPKNYRHGRDRDEGDIPRRSDSAFPSGEPMDDASQDGRLKEWQDRARVSMHKPDPHAHTNLERDFESEDQDNWEEESGEPIY